MIPITHDDIRRTASAILAGEIPASGFMEAMSGAVKVANPQQFDLIKDAFELFMRDEKIEPPAEFSVDTPDEEKLFNANVRVEMVEGVWVITDSQMGDRRVYYGMAGRPYYQPQIPDPFGNKLSAVKKALGIFAGRLALPAKSNKQPAPQPVKGYSSDMTPEGQAAAEAAADSVNTDDESTEDLDEVVEPVGPRQIGPAAHSPTVAEKQKAAMDRAKSKAADTAAKRKAAPKRKTKSKK